ncbi:MAG: hypothetical protein [Circular genetic element sp.]|nr:MAG: hypothetical protein [Circular genetic element sp.]
MVENGGSSSRILDNFSFDRRRIHILHISVIDSARYPRCVPGIKFTIRIGCPVSPVLLISISIRPHGKLPPFRRVVPPIVEPVTYSKSWI